MKRIKTKFFRAHRWELAGLGLFLLFVILFFVFMADGVASPKDNSTSFKSLKRPIPASSSLSAGAGLKLFGPSLGRSVSAQVQGGGPVGSVLSANSGGSSSSNSSTYSPSANPPSPEPVNPTPAPTPAPAPLPPVDKPPYVKDPPACKPNKFEQVPTVDGLMCPLE